MQIRKRPPTRISDSSVDTVNLIGAPSQCLRCSCSVHAANTSFLGASNTRVISNSGTVALASRVPELFILGQPVRDFLKRAGLQFCRSPLRVAPARNETG